MIAALKVELWTYLVVAANVFCNIFSLYLFQTCFILVIIWCISFCPAEVREVHIENNKKKSIILPITVNYSKILLKF